MFDDYWRTCCRSQDSAGKRIVKTPYFWRSAILGKYPKIHILSDDESSQKERARGAARGPHPRATQWCGHPGPLLPAPPRVYGRPQKPKTPGGSEIDSAASAGRKTPREKKLSGRQKSTRKIPSRRGEIVAIIITIELDFIGIIIFITIITSTFIFTITTPSRCNILG
jgi:hypothetical protein